VFFYKVPVIEALHVRSCSAGSEIFKNYRIMNDRLDTLKRDELADSAFGLPERREYPMPDAVHVRAAEAYFRYCPENLKPELAKAILRFAAKYGVDVQSTTVLDYARK